MNRALFCVLSAVCLVHTSSAANALTSSSSSTSKSALELLEPLQDYLDMMSVRSPLTAQVYVITSQGTKSWNQSMAYCQTTFAGVMNADCYLAELLTPQQIKALSTELIGNNWNVWVGAYWKPLKKGNNQWVWYHTGYAINSPNYWMYGFPLALTNGGNYAAAANSFTTWGSVLRNNYAPTTNFYFACTCY